MLTTAPHLRTRRPSPTTVEYTVSTSPTLTLPLRLLLITTIIFRVLIGWSVLLILYSKYLLSNLAAATSTHNVQPETIVSIDYLYYILHLLHTSKPGQFATTLAALTPPTLLIPLSLVLLHILLQRPHTTETLLVLRGLGIQTSSSSASYLSSATTRFIPTEKVQDILVNEAFRGFEVRYYLVVVVEGEDDVVVVFPRLLPRRKVVESVWRGVRGCLWEEGRVGGLSAKGG
ncbi:GPI-GlcNAc transferase complex [Glarea lozoyensis ATCC 20868]|uniref:GPI-GlcNAc transferase complex n=1 Tax=Glarea lozoyensis (strain ATCC 20868 / MF5171) TaxID=1116229 RepID=S3DFG4_GLAL2|nr:GPI-GlcNAc transferase complex [Glarea lozoyensis ATCC 20868]EPE35844.1 GPI-GlcNAc transferase complex [Glarea lozoyensis ATCC 20868]